jgi:zinc protease
VGDNALDRHGNPYPKGDVRYEAAFDEEIAELRALSLQRVRAFHADFYGADHAELAVVGDFDADALNRQLVQLFGDWKGAKPYTRVPKPVYAAPPTELRLETPDKANAYFVARVRFPLRDDSPEYPAALLANRIVGGGSASMLFRRIREKEGLSYGTSSGLSASPHEAHAAWTVEAIYAPQNGKRLQEVFDEEIARATREGFTAQELKDGKNGLLLARRLSLAQDANVAAMLASQLELGRTMEYQAGIDRAIESVSGEEVAGTFRKYVQPGGLVKVYAGDFRKAAAK